MLTRQWVLASRNAGKAEEFGRMLSPLGVQVVMPFIGSHEIVSETGRTYAENAKAKALEVARQLGRITIADDSGVEVDALDGRPGLYSARYVSDDPWLNVRQVLVELIAVPWHRRTARMRAAVVVAWPDGAILLAEGVLEGHIGMIPRGHQGFGYDPVFVLPDGRTLGQLTPAEKDHESHRGRALQALVAQLAAQELGS